MESEVQRACFTDKETEAREIHDPQFTEPLCVGAGVMVEPHPPSLPNLSAR